jgi:hypothetical protein
MNKIRTLIVALAIGTVTALGTYGQIVPETKHVTHKVYHKSKHVTQRTWHKSKHIGRKVGTKTRHVVVGHHHHRRP